MISNVSFVFVVDNSMKFKQLSLPVINCSKSKQIQQREQNDELKNNKRMEDNGKQR